MSGTGWSDLAAAALLGTMRRPVPEGGLPAALAAAAAEVGQAQTAAARSGARCDAAERLLDVAALAAGYRRAGLRPGPPRDVPAPAPADGRRPAGQAAGARLADLLAGGDRELLELWLATAVARGVRPPEPLLPALLDRAIRMPTLAPLLVAVAGPRGRWLARHRRDWAAAVASADDAATQAAGDAAGVVPAETAEPGTASWELGTPGERVAWLRGLRRHDPEAARRLLERGWPQEEPVHRAALLAVLGTGLDGADEPFLERCLGDRRADVRATAARLLTGLPGSALARRGADRALAAVRIERQVVRRRLVVTVPAGYDDQMARDQVPPPPARLGPGGGPGAWLLLHLVAACPLAAWVPARGASPDDVVALEVAEGWRAVLWSGWARAAVREGDRAWAQALLHRLPAVTSAGTGAGTGTGAGPAGGAGSGGRPGPGTDPFDPLAIVGALLALLDDGVRARQVAAWLRARGGPPLPAAVLARAVPAPWPPAASGAVIDWLRERPRLDDPDGRAVLELAARRLPGDHVGALREVAEQWPVASATRRLAGAAAELLAIRRAVLEELQ